MHHENHTTGGGCPKCVINTRLIAETTTVLSAAASAADEVRAIIDKELHARNFHGCEHAAQLVAMTREILDDIEELVTGSSSGGRL